MSGLSLATCLLLGAAGESSIVYHYRDSQGVDHYVNHPEQVPSDATPDRLKLTEDLNPDLAKQMAESAQRAAEEARKGIPAAPGTIALPADARLALIWSIAFTVVFIVLWSTRGLLLRRSPSLAFAFQPLRWGTGVAALLSWIFLASLARGWIVDHLPPLQTLSRTRANVDKINRQQRDAEHELELEKTLNGK